MALARRDMVDNQFFIYIIAALHNQQLPYGQ
jgi:hypothetical protein